MKWPVFVLLLAALFTCAPLNARPLLLEGGALPIEAKGYVERLDDPDGTLSPEEVLLAPRWQALPGALNAGFTDATIWLRLSVRVPEPAGQTWALRLDNALLDDVRLYQRDSDGRWSEQRAGENLARPLWPVDYRSAVFPLRFAEPGDRTLLLRLQSKNAMAVGLDLEPGQQFSNHSRREFFAYGLYFGFYLLLIGFHTVFWRMTRAPESGWYLLYVNCCVGIEVLSLGLPQQLLDLPVSISDPLLGVTLALAIPIGMIFAGRQLGLPQVYPRLHGRLALLCWGIAGVAALAVLNGHYGEGARLSQGSALVLIPFFLGLAFLLLLRGHRPARYYLFAFGVFYAGAVISFMRNLGYVPSNVWTNLVSPIGSMLHMGLMSLRIISHYNTLKRESAQVQARAAEQALRHGEHLEAQVRLRTRELRNEISRRERLEQDLRAALVKEKHVLEEQRDFVAMVSHEFRTPLAIISTSAQQMARNLGASTEKSLQRCQNIRDASTRLMALVDDYLNHDRMTGPNPTLRLAPCDLAALLEDLQADFAPGRIHVDCRLAAGLYQCDAGLLHVAVRNLLANADRHAPPGSAVLVQVYAAADGSVCLEVRNGGEPIPEDERERLFLKYYRGRQSQLSPGAGLGLYLVRRIAELHGGDVSLLSAGEEGQIHIRLRLVITPLQERRQDTLRASRNDLADDGQPSGPGLSVNH